jgi:hypothetical protein
MTLLNDDHGTLSRLQSCNTFDISVFCNTFSLFCNTLVLSRLPGLLRRRLLFLRAAKRIHSCDVVVTEALFHPSGIDVSAVIDKAVA